MANHGATLPDDSEPNDQAEIDKIFNEITKDLEMDWRPYEKVDLATLVRNLRQVDRRLADLKELNNQTTEEGKNLFAQHLDLHDEINIKRLEMKSDEDG